MEHLSCTSQATRSSGRVIRRYEIRDELESRWSIFTTWHIGRIILRHLKKHTLQWNDKYRASLPLFPFTIEQFDFGGYDVISEKSNNDYEKI